jgi:hypothetical protein
VNTKKGGGPEESAAFLVHVSPTELAGRDSVDVVCAEQVVQLHRERPVGVRDRVRLEPAVAVLDEQGVGLVDDTLDAGVAALGQVELGCKSMPAMQFNAPTDPQPMPLRIVFASAKVDTV